MGGREELREASGGLAHAGAARASRLGDRLAANPILLIDDDCEKAGHLGKDWAPIAALSRS